MFGGVAGLGTWVEWEEDCIGRSWEEKSSGAGVRIGYDADITAGRKTILPPNFGYRNFEVRIFVVMGGNGRDPVRHNATFSPLVLPTIVLQHTVLSQ